MGLHSLLTSHQEERPTPRAVAREAHERAIATNMSDHDSSGTSSALKLPAITFKTSRPLPELWTLPREWNMEKREKYDVRIALKCYSSYASDMWPVVLIEGEAITQWQMLTL